MLSTHASWSAGPHDTEPHALPYTGAWFTPGPRTPMYLLSQGTHPIAVATTIDALKRKAVELHALNEAAEVRGILLTWYVIENVHEGFFVFDEGGVCPDLVPYRVTPIEAV